MFDLYRPGTSLLHRLPAGFKVLMLAVLGTLIFLVNQLALILAFLCAVFLLYPAMKLPLSSAWVQIRPALWILVAILLAQGFINGWETGIFVIARFAGLLLLAGLLTLTTRVSDMVEGMERGFFLLKYVGINPAKVSLALSLALRFIPVLLTITTEVREAQKVRGLDRSLIAVAIPVMIRTLRMSDEIADAIETRGYSH